LDSLLSALRIDTEKYCSEFIAAPILFELRKQLNYRVILFGKNLI
jgi:hypothetical protein